MSRSTLQRAVRLLQRRTGDFRNNVHQAWTWRGEQPPVYLRPHPDLLHSVWRTYKTDPPLRYAPSPVAQLVHAVNRLTPQNRKHILELEHPFHPEARNRKLLRLYGHALTNSTQTLASPEVKTAKP